MRQRTYDRFEQIKSIYKGYITTKELLKEGFSNRQILYLQKEGLLEKIYNGYFWLSGSGIEKPKDFKAVEVGFVNKNAIIVADSACFYQDFIDVEPVKLSIATRRTDRRLMTFPFQVTRHYLAEESYEEHIINISTKFGSYKVYDIDRSVWDCIRFRESISPEIFDMIMEKYKKLKINDENTREQLLAYAKAMKFEERARKVFEL